MPRLVSYNILDGGAGRESALLSVLAAQNADIIALVEADDPSIVEKFARELEMDFIHAPGNTKASALLSRFPISQTINHAPLHQTLSKSLLEATVVAPDGVEWLIGVPHLHARATEEDESQREREIDQVSKIFERHRAAGRPHLLAGDFNSNAPYQQLDPTRCKPGTREAWQKNGGHIPRRVVSRILDAGYVDSLSALHPEQAQTFGTFSTEFPGQRVDYIFTFGIEPFRMRAAWITYDPPADEASDHFPIGLEWD